MKVLSDPGRFAPTTADSPTLGRICIICETPICIGDRPALVERGPASDEDAAKAAAGKAHTVECDIAHETCAIPF